MPNTCRMIMKNVPWLAAMASMISVVLFAFINLDALYISIPVALSAVAAIFSWVAARRFDRQQKNTEGELTAVVRNHLYNDGSSRQISAATLTSYLKATSSFITGIGEGKLSSDFLPKSDDRSLNAENLTSAVLTMKNRMVAVASEERQRHWTSAGLADFSQISRVQGRSFQEMLDQFIAKLVKYVGANQGAIFLANTHEAETTLSLSACYAYDRKKYLNREIAPGEGLVGQAFLEGQPILMTAVPPDYISITSGLGEALPRCVVIVPLKYNEKTEGIMELASFTKLESYQLEFVNKVAEILAAAIASVNTTATTQRLLESTQEQASQLRLKEEQLQQNLEELTATQEAVERKSREAQEQNNRLTAILDSTVDAILTVNAAGIIKTVNKAGTALFGFTVDSLVGKNLMDFLQTSEYQWADMSKSMGRQFTVKALSSTRKTVPVELVMNTANGSLDAITVIMRDVSERHKAEEEQCLYVEQLRAQEEELRQNMEELSATQDEINRQMIEISKINRELDARVAALDTSTIMSESDLYGTITFANPKFVEVSQYSLDELIGKPHKIVRHPDMPSAVFKLMWTTIKSGNVFRGIVKNRKKDGNHYWVDAVISPVLGEDGTPVKYIGVRYVIEDEEQAQKLFEMQRLALIAKGIIVDETAQVENN